MNNIAKTVAAIVLMLAAVATAQQDNRTGLIAYQGSQDMWNQHWSSGTRTDMAPKFEAPAGVRYTNNPLMQTQESPTPNSERAWKPADKISAGQCPYTSTEAARMTNAVDQAQSELGALAPLTVLQMRTINENAERRCNGQNGR